MRGLEAAPALLGRGWQRARRWLGEPGSWRRGLLAGAAGGAALALSFPSAGIFPLAWGALAPLLVFLLSKPSWRSVAVAHLAFCLAYFGAVLYWIPRVMVVYGRMPEGLSLAVFALMLLTLSLYPLPFTLATRWLAGRTPRLALAAAPALWTGGELWRNYFIVDGFPWAALGYSQHRYLWVVQAADLVGVYGLSWLLAAASAALAAWWALGWRQPALADACLLALCNLYGAYRVHGWEPPGESALEVALVQPDIAVAGDRDYYAQAYFRQLPDQYARAAAAGADLVIFPEAPNPYVFLDDFYFRTFYQRLVSDYRTPLVFNGAARRPAGGSFNSAFLLEADGTVGPRYDKLHLVPFGEYLPYGRLLGFSRPLVSHVGGFVAGDGDSPPLRVGDTPLGLLICYEAIFPELSRRASGQGAGLLVNLTNDLWFGDTAAPEQHLQMAAFRALEQRKYLLRAANSGYSGAVDPWGRIVRRSGLFRREILKVEVRSNSHRSLYSRWGDAPVFSIILVGVLAVLVGWARNVR